MVATNNGIIIIKVKGTLGWKSQYNKPNEKSIIHVSFFSKRMLVTTIVRDHSWNNMTYEGQELHSMIKFLLNRWKYWSTGTYKEYQNECAYDWMSQCAAQLCSSTFCGCWLQMNDPGQNNCKSNISNMWEQALVWLWEWWCPHLWVTKHP